MQLILASSAPARKEALEQLGLIFSVISPDIDEKAIRHDDPKQMVRMIAEAKARAVDAQGIIIAGDLFVTMDGNVYEKPENKEEAKQMLQSFSGKTVAVISGACVYNTLNDRMESTVDVCEMRFRELKDNEIDKYVQENEVTRFAAGYDHKGQILFVDHVCGSFNYELGFSVSSVIKLLRKQGVDV
mgnify:CR=1 FL=1